MELSAEGLCVTLGGRAVLDGVSTTFEPGRVTAVLGANGAGKSTLLRTIAALVPVQAGRVVLHGANVTAMPARERAQAIGYLPQDAAVHWNMGVRDLVALGRLPHGDAGAEAIGAALAHGSADEVLTPATIAAAYGVQTAITAEPRAIVPVGRA